MTDAITLANDRSAAGLVFDARVRADAPGRQETIARRHLLGAIEFARAIRESGVRTRRPN